MTEQNKLVVFQEKQIRRIWHNEEWWFAIQDVIEVLTGTQRVRKYWSDLKKKLADEGYMEVSDNIGQLKVPAKDGKMRKTDCANTETMFRIIQSIPSPKAEPFKRWLAKVGYERIQEIENPELAAERARQYYRDLGYSEDWITKRMQSIEIRGQLTDEWKGRGVEKGLEYLAAVSLVTSSRLFSKMGFFGFRYMKLKAVTLLSRFSNLILSSGSS